MRYAGLMNFGFEEQKGKRPVLFMAPMEGITDIPFRRLVKNHGCDIICTQMIHAQGLLRGEQARMQEATALDPNEKPVGFQLCGSEPEYLSEAAKKVEDMGFAFIDFNMGCPAKNVVKRGSGAALLKDPQKAEKAILALTQSVKSIPITVKIRVGWDNDYHGGMEIAKLAQNAGAKLVSVHARTRSQKFKGQADWNLIKQLKEQIDIPVVGNGDIFEPGDVEKMYAQTGADGVMVARGALGNPWIFAGKRPTIGEVYEVLMQHFEEHLTFYPNQRSAMITFRKHIVWYTKGMRNATDFRVKVFKENDLDKVKQMLHDYFEQFDPNEYPDQHEDQFKRK